MQDPRITVAWLKKWDAFLVKRDGAPKKTVKKEAKGSPSKKGGVKKEEPEDVKPAKKGVGKKQAMAAAQAKEDVKLDKLDRAAAKDADKMQLDLKILPISQYFPQTMLKKFRVSCRRVALQRDTTPTDMLFPQWASYDDNNDDLPADWTFVKDAKLKIRTNSE